jgi:hypothetical protein
MKNFFVFLAALLFSSFAYAVDVTATLTVLYDGKPVLQQSNVFYGLSDVEAKDLQTRGLKQLDFASKHQDKGGKYTLVWKWGDEVAIETAGMKFGPVNATMRQGLKWLDDTLKQAEGHEKGGKAKPFGHGKK